MVSPSLNSQHSIKLDVDQFDSINHLNWSEHIAKPRSELDPLFT